MAQDLVEIASDSLSARINPTGAELWSLCDTHGAQYMTDADPAFWGGHAPLLFPIVGSLAGDRLRVDGIDHAMPRHGFARHSAFDVVEQAPDRVRFRLTDSADTRAVYPFAFALEIDFRLDGWRLVMAAHVHNPGAEPLPFSFGYHPAFAWPLPGGADKAAHRLTFEWPEPGPVRRVARDTGLLLPEAEASPVTGRDLPLDADLFRADAVIWTDLASRALRYGAPGGASLDIAFPDTPMLGLWQVPGGHYICIEPWQGHADPQGFDGEFATKPGLVILPPGAVRSFRLSVLVNP
ncbi:aldose 1-epimerase family protein [Novosphingobium sp. FSW06-99]|uniref:aldose 1-epimerase family protein n=1 Tax=Novosphingobium sp. FSW06-99 TaxID=1739113 RepID=UPI00076CF57F|nr:aldose 1-epimerase family protein [Novosphingobium sp. FSW06-99]KUR76400.1 aldose epimerase [Novosphingobium sp. FSW06-99]